eukprot:TRINITY_DN6459_c0_g1_i1.p1 TRINITY_DN6459_c0_g1~~TRINITY_DN6459_c0_g1_i1.p1  ORF type:complete len:366 (+),score=66.09 TRINITY_DN6459_c0_g1_i1:119-1216(+)
MEIVRVTLAQLRYPGRFHDRIVDDCLSVSRQFPNLQPLAGAAPYCAEQHLKLSGLLPVNVQGKVYHFPFTVWFPLYYPDVAPRMYVNPTETMQVKQGHSCVAPDGACNHYELTTWHCSSHLVHTISTLVQVFSRETPLYARASPPPAASNWGPPPPGQAVGVSPANPYTQPQQPQYSGRPPSPPVRSPFEAVSSHAAPPVASPAPAPSGEEDWQQAMRDMIVPRMRETIRACCEEHAAEKNDAFRRHTDRLNELKEIEFSHDLRQWERECESVEAKHEIGRLEQEKTGLEAWIAENKSKAALTTQISEHKSADQVCDELAELVDGKLRERAISPEVYNMKLQEIFRQQFLQRWLVLKCEDKMQRS